MTGTVNILSRLGQWPRDCADQQEYINRFKTLLSEFETYVEDNTNDLVILEQATVPTQGEWETAWTAQTGKSLPIAVNAMLYWWDSTNDELGGVYGVVQSGSNVQSRDSAYPRNGLVLLEEAYLSAYQTINTQIGVNNSYYPSLTIQADQRMKLELTYIKWTQLVSGSGVWGADFLLDGEKVGNTYYGVAADQGMFMLSSSGLLRATAIVPVVEPGEHTIQVIFGYTGTTATPPTIGFGGTGLSAGNYGIRQLIVRGYAL